MPPDEKDDKQMIAAVDLLHGVKRADGGADATPRPSTPTTPRRRRRADDPPDAELKPN